MVDVFEQVEEELRSDRYKRLARSWLPILGVALLVALIAALAFWGWDNMQTSRADKGSVAFDRGLQSLQANNPVGADAAFTQAAKDGNGAYKAMALMHRAGIAVDANRIPDALRLFDEASKASRDPLLADAAALKAAYLAMDAETLAQVEARLEPLAEDGRPLAPFAVEALAMARLQAGQTAPARAALVLLKNGLDTPQIVGQRAELTLAAIDAGAAANLKAIVEAQKRLPVQAPPPPSAQVPQSAPPASAPARP
ncbi:MAG TPA: tetratricopeptide repeat protein [Brevundimonas sp.]|nr:tetratricopeptide repeat protein [Brevundimonas sp.]